MSESKAQRLEKAREERAIADRKWMRAWNEGTYQDRIDAAIVYRKASQKVHAIEKEKP